MKQYALISCFCILCGLSSGTIFQGADCNGNGVEDLQDVLGIRFQEEEVVQGAYHPLIADWDGDQRMDLAAINSDGSSFSVLINQGAGVFGKPIVNELGFTPGSTLVADWGGDGNVDLAAISSDGSSFSLFLNQGAGVLGKPIVNELEFTPGLTPDLNGDTRPDLVGQFGEDIAAAINRGDGTFEKPAVYEMGATSYLTALIACDLNGDDKPDLVAATEPQCSETGCSRDVAVFLNRGDGIFLKPVWYKVEGALRWQLMAYDLNGDGKPELVISTDFSCAGVDDVANCHPGVFVLLNRGDGSFQLPALFTETSPWSLGSLLIGDFIGDGKPDLAWLFSRPLGDGSSSLGQIIVLHNRGDGILEEPVMVGEVEDASSLGTWDFNGDGRSDFAVARNVCSRTQTHDVICHATTFVLMNHGDGNFEKSDALYEADQGYGELFVSDVNGDGEPDLVNVWHDGRHDGEVCWVGEYCHSGGFNVLLNRGDGTFEKTCKTQTSGGLANPMCYDLDGNGRTEIISADVDNLGIWIYWNRTIPPSSLDLNHNGIPDECETRFRRGDTNADGRMNISDAIVTLGFLFLGNAEMPSCNKSADTNDDGKLDLLDAVALLSHLFLGAPAPPQPFEACGLDPTEDDLGCAGLAPCT